MEDKLKELEDLTPQEKELLTKILSEIGETGTSNTYQALLYNDYKEIPVDIETFVDDDLYLGNAWKDKEGKSKLYPFWRNKLKELFPDNLTTNVNNLIVSGARGIGKSELAVTINLYLMHRVLCLKDPLEHFKMKPTEKICFAFMNITKDLAEEIGVSKFQNTVKLSPWFLERGKLVGRTDIIWEPPEFIEIIIGSQPRHVIGRGIFCAFFDEISFIPNQDIDKQKKKAIDMIDTAIGGMKTRFIYNGENPTLLILASSKRSEKSFLEEHMKKQLEVNKENVMIVDEAVWNVKPPETYSGVRFKVALGNKFLASQVIPPGDDIRVWESRGYKIIDVPIEFKSNFDLDIERSLCDFAGISSSELSKYISGAAVKEIVDEKLNNPFTKEILEIGNGPDDKFQYYDFFNQTMMHPKLRKKPLFIHLDMSVTGDRTGIAGVWIAGKRPSTDKEQQAKDLYYSLAFSVAIKAPKGRQISFEKNRNFIYWLKEQGFNIKGISTDSYQSYDTGQALIAKGYNYKQISVDRVDRDNINKPYQYFKSTIYEKRLEIYDSRLLIQEITDLERNLNNGKVDHPDGGSKDISDAVCGALFFASENAEQYAYDYGENISTVLDVNREQSNPLVVDFEEELRQLNNPLGGRTNNENNNQVSSSIGEGIIIW